MTFFDLISFLLLRNYLFQQKSFSSMPFNTRCFIRCIIMKYPFQIYKTLYIRRNVYEKVFKAVHRCYSISVSFFISMPIFTTRQRSTYVLQFQNTISIMRSIFFRYFYSRNKYKFFFFFLQNVFSRDV